MNDPTPEIKLSATILLLRDGERDLEVFMVERHHQIDFATGAMVFPGGKVDPGDRAPALRPHCDGVDQLDDDAMSVRVAAIRETFEEAGVLLARPRGERKLLAGERLASLDERYRDPLHEGALSLRELVEREQLVLACDHLVRFAHWITPEVMPKRFDTHFFLAGVPADQLAEHDGGENVDSRWTTAADAVRAQAAGECTIIFPTLTNLRKLGRSHSVEAALEAARTSDIVTVLPWVTREEDGQLSLCIPEEADYDLVKAPVSALR